MKFPFIFLGILPILILSSTTTGILLQRKFKWFSFQILAEMCQNPTLPHFN